MKNKKIFIIGLILVILGILLFVIFNKEEETDASKFKSEYSKVSEDNPFVYRNIDEIIKILEKGTGVVYFGFPSCKWCQAYVPYVEEVAASVGIDKVYYYNIKEDRKNNTEEYQKIVEILDVYLENDEEGNKRIYVPAIVVVKDGQIVDYNDETASDTKGYEDAEEYWKNFGSEDLKTALQKAFNEIKSTTCTSECNE